MKKLLLMMIILNITGCVKLAPTNGNGRKGRRAKKVASKPKNYNEKEEYLQIKGINLSRQKKYSEAIPILLKAYQKDKKNALTLKELGFAYSKIGDLKNAEKFFERTLAINPNEQLVKVNLAVIAYKKGKNKRTVQLLNSLTSDKINNRVRLLRGSAYYNIKEYEKAYNDLKRLSSTSAVKNFDYITKYIETMKKTKRVNEIYPFLYGAYRVGKNSEEYILAYSKYLVSEFEDRKEAIKVLEKYSRSNHSDKVLTELTSRYIEFEDFRNANRVIRRISDRYKYDKEVLELKLIIASEMGDTAEANRIMRILRKLEQ